MKGGEGDRDLQEGLTYWELQSVFATELAEAENLGKQIGRRGEEDAPNRHADYIRAEIQLTGHHLAARDTSFLHGRSSDPYVIFLQ